MKLTKQEISNKRFIAQMFNNYSQINMHQEVVRYLEDFKTSMITTSASTKQGIKKWIAFLEEQDARVVNIGPYSKTRDYIKFRIKNYGDFARRQRIKNAQHEIQNMYGDIKFEDKTDEYGRSYTIMVYQSKYEYLRDYELLHKLDGERLG